MPRPTPSRKVSRQTPPRVMLLATTTGYQTQEFAAAARRLGLEVVFGTDRCQMLEDPWRDGALALRFEDPDAAAIRTVLAVGESLALE